MIELKDGIKLNPETMMFTTEVDGHTFECKNYQGLLNSITGYMEMVEVREGIRDELVPVYRLGSDKEFLYHPLRSHIYVVNIHNKLTRVNVDIYKDQFFENKDYAEEVNCMMLDASDKSQKFGKLAYGYKKDLEAMAVKVKHYKKKGN